MKVGVTQYFVSYTLPFGPKSHELFVILYSIKPTFQKTCFLFYFYFIRSRLQLIEDSANYVRYCASNAIFNKFCYCISKTKKKGFGQIRKKTLYGLGPVYILPYGPLANKDKYGNYKRKV